MPNVNANIRFTLKINIETGDPKPNGLGPYMGRSSVEQSDAKRRLLGNVSTSEILQALSYWQFRVPSNPIEVDNYFHETVAQTGIAAGARYFIAYHLRSLNGLLAQGTNSFQLELGTICPQQPCTKLPNCSHDCLHEFMLNTLTPDGKGGTVRAPWIVNDADSAGKNGTGVTADVVVMLEWTTPIMSMSADMSGSPDASDAGV